MYVVLIFSILLYTVSTAISEESVTLIQRGLTVVYSAGVDGIENNNEDSVWDSAAGLWIREKNTVESLLQANNGNTILFHDSQFRFDVFYNRLSQLSDTIAHAKRFVFFYHGFAIGSSNDIVQDSIFTVTINSFSTDDGSDNQVNGKLCLIQYCSRDSGYISIPVSNIIQPLYALPCSSVVVFIAAQYIGSRNPQSIPLTHLYARTYTKNDIFIHCALTPTDSLRHRYTDYLLHALGGAADTAHAGNRDRAVDAFEIISYMDSKASEITGLYGELFRSSNVLLCKDNMIVSYY